jgi:hypothetical protein
LLCATENLRKSNLVFLCCNNYIYGYFHNMLRLHSFK